MRVVAEHPVDLVRDEYLRQVADRCRVDIERLRPLMDQAVRGVLTDREDVRAESVPLPRRTTSGSRPARAALALMIHAPEAVDGRFESCYFLDALQRLCFDALSSGRVIAECVDELERQEEFAAAEVIREISVEELSENLATDREIAEVTAQLIRAASAEALREVERDLRSGLVTPDSALQVVRDVKGYLAKLHDPEDADAERELRTWLVARESSRDL